MKKNLAILLCSTLLLVGCKEQPQSENNNPDINQNQNNDNGGENNNQNNDNGNNNQNQDNGGENNNQNNDNGNSDNGNNNNQNNDNGNNNNQNQDNGGDNNQTNNETTNYKVTFQTYGDAFNYAMPKRTQLSGSSNAANVEKFANYIKDGLMYNDVVSSLEFNGYVQALDADQGVVYLCLGSSNTDGAMTWNSTRKILKVETTVINYYKTYTAYVEGQAVPGVTSDMLAHFQIDETDYSLELTESLVPEEKTFSATYGEEGTNSFTFMSVGGRVLIKSITVTWKI